uniref:SPATA31/FAM205 domain-containing protein n=1 Tax=Otolemur garnettii TaxID=30611 RepID=H0XR02_OTOGA
SSTPWVNDIILGILCGLVLFLLLLPCLWGFSSPPPTSQERSTKERHVEKRRPKSRKKNFPLKTCRDSLKELEATQDLLSLLQSPLGPAPDKASFLRLFGEDTGRRRPLDCSAPLTQHSPPLTSTLSPGLLASPPPLTEHPPLLVSTLSPGPAASSGTISLHSSLSASRPPEPLLSLLGLSPRPFALSLPPLHPMPPAGCLQRPKVFSAPPVPESSLTLSHCDSVGLPLSTFRQNSPHKHLSASPISAITGLGGSNCPISTLSWWQAPAKAWGLSTLSDGKSQQGHLSHCPAETSLWRGSTNRQLEAGSPFLLSSDNQKLLEIQVTNGVKINIWEEKEKDASFPGQTSPKYNLKSLGNMLKSQNAEQNTTTSRPFWSMENKPEQLPSPEKLSYPSILKDHFQQKYSQLFWGLPSRHSESLVATAWISERSSTLQPPSYSFNGISNVNPVSMQAKMSPLLSHLESQSQPLTSLSQLESLSLIQTQAHLQTSFPLLSPASPPHINDGVPYPISQNKAQSFIPTEIKHTGCSSPKRRETGQVLSYDDHRSPEAFGLYSPTSSQDNLTSILPENFPISPELRKQLQQHIQKWLVQQQPDLGRTQESLEVPLQEKSPETCQEKGIQGPLRSSLSMGGSNKDIQKVTFYLEKAPGTNLGQILGKAPKDLSCSIECSPLKAAGANSEFSERSSMTSSRSNSGKVLLANGYKNHLENILKARMDVSRQTNQDPIPVSVPRSWQPPARGLSVSDTHLENRNMSDSKSWDTYVDTSQDLSFLSPRMQQDLAAHIARFWVKHRWALPLKVLKPVNILKLKKTHSLPLPQSPSLPSPTYESVPNLLDEPQAVMNRVTTEESFIMPASRFTHSSLYKEIQKASQGTSPSHDHGPSESPLPGQESRHSSLPNTYSPMGRTQQSRNLGPQSMRTEETRASVPQYKIFLGSSMPSNLQVRNENENNLEVPRTSRSPVLPRMALSQDPEELCLLAEVVSDFEPRGAAKSENQPNVCGTTVLLPDPFTNILLNTDSLTSQEPQSYLRSGSIEDKRASQILGEVMAARRRSLGLQEPKTCKYQNSSKNQSKMCTPVCKSECNRKLHVEKCKEKFEELGTCQLSRARETEVAPQVLAKRQVLPENNFRKHIKKFFQWIIPKVKGKPALCNTQKPKPRKTKPCMDSNTTEAQGLMSAMGQMLEEKMMVRHKFHASKINQHNQAPVCQFACHHRAPLCPEQNRMPVYAVCNQQAIHKCPSHPIVEKSFPDLQTLKNSPFQSGLKHPHLMLTRKATPTDSPYQQGSRLLSTSSHYRHCPRHCLLQGGV